MFQLRPTRLLVMTVAISCATILSDHLTESSGFMNSLVTATEVVVQAESFAESSNGVKIVGEETKYVSLSKTGWLLFEVTIPEAGRYKLQLHARASAAASAWVEDYVDNKDGRTYNITGAIPVPVGQEFGVSQIDGSPLNSGKHRIKLHVDEGTAQIDKLVFTLMRKQQDTPEMRQQKMDGKDWHLVWADEFDGHRVDENKWSFDIGNWGWGNNELQYYTENATSNARTEDGNLIIEARKNDQGQPWTSARMTTRGKVSFLYGKIEIRAKVPREKGCWAAGWTLGDQYVDEKSWPYCGEIDILESVGFEVDDQSGDGIAHATCHTPAYYFKINNQITSTKKVENMAGEFHTYGVEWTPTEIRGYVDGEQYYVYDKNANEQEWPFDKPQNIILNLAMGGGWGGAQGMDETVTSQKFVIDYVRVYEKR